MLLTSLKRVWFLSEAPLSIYYGKDFSVPMKAGKGYGVD